MVVLLVALLLLVFLAAANGGNDVSKGVATLAGARATSYRTAIIWGTATTFAGSLLSIVVSGTMVKLFSSGIVAGEPTPQFTIAVLAATGAWVALATRLTLPVSTTQALVGALVGAGLLLSPRAVQWSALLPNVVQPLLLSVLVAYLVSATLNGLATLVRRGRPRPAQVTGHHARPTDRLARAVGPADADAPPATATAATATAATATATATATAPDPAAAARDDDAEHPLRVPHLCSSGATSLARGLNDTPKLVAVGAFALHPAGMTTVHITLLVAVAMAAGALAAGLRLTRRLGEDVVTMSHGEGFRANLVTAVLVGLGAQAGLPMSTTQVSASAIAGAAGFQPRRIHLKTVQDFVTAWTVTPAFAASLAGLLSWLLSTAIG